MVSIRKLTLIGVVVLLCAQAAVAQDMVYSDREIIRNGDFQANLYTAWHMHWTYVHEWAGKEDGYGMRMERLGVKDDRYCFQKLSIPSKLDSATIRFDYRAVEEYAPEGLPVVLHVAIAKSQGFDSANLEQPPPLTMIGDIFTQTIDGAFDWREFSADLDASIMQAMQSAHDDGEMVFLFLSQSKVNDAHGYITDIDNISLKVSGTQTVPAMQGKIAYLEELDDGDPYAISILDPNDREAETIWTHPDGRFGDWSNITWKPDASELAFVSDHDFAFYVFKANIFSIKPDGSDLHRIPKVPTQDDIDNGDYPKVTVKGTLEADTGSSGERYTIIMGIQGTDKGEVIVASEGERVPFTIPDVPVLDDPSVFNQPIIMQYSSTNCTGGLEFAFPIAAVGNGAVDLGTIKFFDANCIGSLTDYQPRCLAWKPDGTEIGFSLLGLRTIDVESTTEFDLVKLEPNSGLFSDNLAWSPADDRYLYLNFSGSTTNYYVHLASEGGGEPSQLLEDIEDVTPAWLPDGSGFIYVGWPDDEMVDYDNNIYHYDLATSQRTRLTYFRKELIDHIDISPDGRHILFQLRNKRLDPSHSNLWILDRLNPVEMWPLTDSGNCSYPAWSRTTVPDIDDEDPPTPDDDGDTDGGGDGGGGGGCFIESSE